MFYNFTAKIPSLTTGLKLRKFPCVMQDKLLMEDVACRVIQQAQKSQIQICPIRQTERSFQCLLYHSMKYSLSGKDNIEVDVIYKHASLFQDLQNLSSILSVTADCFEAGNPEYWLLFFCMHTPISMCGNGKNQIEMKVQQQLNRQVLFP